MRAVYSVPELGTGDGLLKKFVAANLSFYLKERGLNQRSFAKEIEVSEASVSAWLHGDKLPRDQHWPKILKVLHLRMTDLTQDPDLPRDKPPPPLPPPPPPAVPEKDLEPVLRFLRRQANALGWDLHKLPDNQSE